VLLRQIHTAKCPATALLQEFCPAYMKIAAVEHGLSSTSHAFNLEGQYAGKTEVGLATGYGLDGPGSTPASARIFSPARGQTGSGAHLATYPTGAADNLSMGKAAGT
jgi:hypothetical protein